MLYKIRKDRIKTALRGRGKTDSIKNPAGKITENHRGFGASDIEADYGFFERHPHHPIFASPSYSFPRKRGLSLAFSFRSLNHISKEKKNENALFGNLDMRKKQIHLVCNSHIDPVWLWEWEEGAGVAIATFRTAADFCETFDGFVFNHNEAILYQWIEEYDSQLFKRIQRLVRKKRWHIMGGWYLQPDCNMPSGESFIRQILKGKSYFKDKFGVEPTCAVNLDPFGHTRGLVQILAKSGYDAYLCCRPSLKDCGLPASEFTWVGYDESRVTGMLATTHYNSSLGEAGNKVEQWIQEHPEDSCSLVLWGVGNHGGGPSRIDLKSLEKLARKETGFEILHSTPERYFKELSRRKTDLKQHKADLNPWAVGCYTSQARIKQKHRHLENTLFMVEKMASIAAYQGLMNYPRAELDTACLDLAAVEFHDALPGSSIPEAEEGTIQQMDHGLEILSRVRARAFFALASGQGKAQENEFPVLVFNPHPHEAKAVIECEMQPAEPNRQGTFLNSAVYHNGRLVPSQLEKESSNILEDFRKRVVFSAVLEPGKMNRFDCRFEPLLKKPAVTLKEKRGFYRFKTGEIDVVINARTGLMDRYRVKGEDYLEKRSFLPLVIHDDADPWGMKVSCFRRRAGAFRLMSMKEGAHFSGVSQGSIPSVRVIEDGPVRTVIEAVLSFNQSSIVQRYKLPKIGTEVEVEIRVFWNEKDRMLKLSVPTRFKEAKYLGQVACGVESLRNNGDEVVAHQWVAAVSRRKNRALTVINNGTYGSDMNEGEVRLSLLRSPAYAGHPVEGKTFIVEQDRVTPRIDQGEHLFRYWINGGTASSRLLHVDHEAQVKNEKPFALAFFPSGGERKPKPGIKVNDKAIRVMTVKEAEKSGHLIVRLFETTGRKRSFRLSLPFVRGSKAVTMSKYEIKTFRFSPVSRSFTEVDLMEKPIGKRRN